ncbi:MAG: response regulator transcription factor [Solirubrobacteraceae bacterium]
MAPAGDTRTVLVADDDPDIRDLLAFKLEQMGYRVLLAPDGAQALAMATADPPDIAVLDLMMPAMTGVDVCRALRQHGETAYVPVILLTARTHERDVQNGFASGADDYVTKPFSPRELASRVQAVLARARG